MIDSTSLRIDFRHIELKPLSLEILLLLSEVDAPIKVAELAERFPHEIKKKDGTVSDTKRAIDSAITKTLVRRGFVVREAKLTKFLKKEYNLVRLTEYGKQYVAWLKENKVD